MDTGTSSLFSQLLSMVDRNEFRRLVSQTGSEDRSKGFQSWDHFVSMLFCQLFVLHWGLRRSTPMSFPLRTDKSAY